MRSPGPLFLALSLLATRVLGASQFIECASPLIVTGLLTGLINAVVTLFSPANSHAGCRQYCDETEDTTYSLFQPGLLGVLGSCFCTNQQPTAGFTVFGSNDQGGCGDFSYQIAYLGPVAELLGFTGCTTGTVPGAGSPPPFNTPNADDCFNTCAAFKHLIMTPPPAGSAFTCQCANVLVPGAAATCGRNVQNIYNNPSIIAPSGDPIRKRRQLAMEKRLAEGNSPCPSDTEACLIPGSAHAWECVDTSSDLESCGGCVTAVYGHPDRNATGVDCTVGAAVGGASCSRGICKQWRCARGWALEGDRCVRKFGTNQERRRR